MKSFLFCFEREMLILGAAVLTICAPGCSTLGKLNPFGGSSEAAESTSSPQKTAGGFRAGGSQAIYQTKSAYVRVESIEPGAIQNDQPVSLTGAQIQTALASLRTAKDGDSVFNDYEIKEISGPIASALSKAGPAHDVVFGVSGEHGAQSLLSVPVITTGRIFYKNGGLNVIFGEMRLRNNDQLVSTGYLESAVLKEFPAGSRASPSRNAALVGDGNVSFATNNRRDWVLVGFQARPPVLGGAPASNATPSAAVPAGKEKDIERRLTTLKNLHDKGLITDQEFDEKRKELLKDL